jgi:hypothetical protein
VVNDELLCLINGVCVTTPSLGGVLGAGGGGGWVVVDVEGVLGSSGAAMVLICLLFVCVWWLSSYCQRHP